ncbi:MAG: hypothetical protein KGI50_07430 [Patescibacteria group bacterium]|nr:hypothetical protein [Patescibacteria group bacterium]MDE2438788.1 hypothetical protein [Patescibacteria group bacterium]
MDVERINGVATLIMAWLTPQEVEKLGGASYPVHLVGFCTDSDYEIIEQAYMHYENLIKSLRT